MFIKGFFSNSVGIMTSRILGLIRDLLTASILGAGIFSDVFFIAFKIPNLFRRIFGVGALLAIIPALFGGSWLIQAIFFGVGSLLALWLLKPLMARWFAARDTKTGMDALIGRKAFVSEAIKVGDGGGRIAVDGDSWRAISSVSHDLPAGSEVRITGYTSLVLQVEPIQ